MTSRYTLHFASFVDAHPGVSNGIATGWVEAVSVALARHHEPPLVVLRVVDDGDHDKVELTWSAPTAQEVAAWDDPPRATEWAAEAIAVIAAHVRRGLTVFKRARRGSRVDFYLTSPGQTSLEHAVAFEVAGRDREDLRKLLRDKLRQASRNPDRLPAIAAVVRFDVPEVMIRDVEHG